MSCSSYDNSTASPAVILSSAGTVVYRARAGSVFGMPWNALVGTHTIVNGSTDLSSLCALDGTSWDGKVVLGGAFYGPGCSYERRAIAAATRKAAGVLFRGQHHSPFDWDGSSQRGLADSSVALDTEYACIEKAVAELGGEATIQLSPVPTPLSQTWYLALGWAWFAVILAALLVSICVGAWQQWRFWRYGMEMSSRAVVGMEMVMLSMLFIRMLNGPGYDHGWQSLIPHYASRMALSLTFSLHLLAMLLVSKQLRRTQEQVEQRRDADDVEDEAEGLCTRYGREVHSGFAIFFLCVVTIDLALAILGATYRENDLLVSVIFILNVFLLGGMGVYYLRTARSIQGLLSEASRLSCSSGTTARVVQYSRNIKRAGILLLLEFVFLVALCILVVLRDGSLVYYVGTTLCFAPALMCLILQSLFLMLSYRPNLSKERRTTTIFTKRQTAAVNAYGSSADLGRMASLGNLRVNVDSSRFSENARPSPSPQPRSCAPDAFDSSRASHNEPDVLELTRSPSRRASPMARTASKFASSKSFKGLSGLAGSNFNLFEEIVELPSSPAAATDVCAAGAAPAPGPILSDKV